MKRIQRYILTQEEAVKIAKSRAKTRYRTQYIYAIEQDGATVYFIRELLEKVNKPVLKVLYSGDVLPVKDTTFMPVYRIRFMLLAVPHEVRWQMPDPESALRMLENRKLGDITAITSVTMMLPPEDWLEGNSWKQEAFPVQYKLWCAYQETGIAEGFIVREISCQLEDNTHE